MFNSKKLMRKGYLYIKFFIAKIMRVGTKRLIIKENKT